MKWHAQRDVVCSRSPSHSEGQWGRWFAWYPVTIATSKDSARWVWLEFVERKWTASRYGRTRRRSYRLSHSPKAYHQEAGAPSTERIRREASL
jgi:hypothetical protein